MMVASFNPRPPISQRATALLLRPWPGRCAVSIHARQFHSGRPCAPVRRIRRGSGFNPRPPISQRATPRAHQEGHGRSSFNPRPPISQRATARTPSSRDRCGVSIHARQFHSGRPSWRPQSDTPACRFNPRPPISQRATVGRRSVPRDSFGFNPRPPISQRATPRSQVLVSKGKNHRIPRTGLDRGASEVLAACDQEQSWHGTGTCATREPPGPKAVTRGSRRP